MLAALFALSLAACGSGEADAPVEAPAAVAAPQMLGGVDLNEPLRALGTEPFWGVAISPDALVYTGIDEAQPVTAPNPGPELQGTTAVYASATTDGTAMVVTLVATECSDGMSDRVYPLTARVELGELSLNGCAQSAAVLDAEPRP
jgi:uncharacterized membrane protein